MGTKCLKNRILVPNFTYKLTQKAWPNSLFCWFWGLIPSKKALLSPLLRARHPKSSEQVNKMGTKHPQKAPFGTQFHAFRQFAYFFRRLFCGLPLESCASFSLFRGARLFCLKIAVPPATHLYIFVLEKQDFGDYDEFCKREARFFCSGPLPLQQGQREGHSAWHKPHVHLDCRIKNGLKIIGIFLFGVIVGISSATLFWVAISFDIC